MSSTLCTITAREFIRIGNRVSTPFGNKLARRIESDPELVDAQDFAHKSKIPPANVYKWLAGETVPRPFNVARVAEFFGDDDLADWLRVAGYPIGDPKSPTEIEQTDLSLLRSFPWIQAILPDLASIPPDQQQLVVDLIRNLGRRGLGTGQ